MPSHPGNKHLNRPLPPWLVKNDLNTQLQRHFQSGELASYAKKCSTINEYKSWWHRRLQAMNTTKFWTPQHQKLTHHNWPSRKVRTFLAQLRSGYCARLNSYKHRLNPAVHNSCPDCNATPHSVVYLFECPMYQTNLTPVNLWLQPKEVAEFLNA